MRVYIVLRTPTHPAFADQQLLEPRDTLLGVYESLEMAMATYWPCCIDGEEWRGEPYIAIEKEVRSRRMSAETKT